MTLANCPPDLVTVHRSQIRDAYLRAQEDFRKASAAALAAASPTGTHTHVKLLAAGQHLSRRLSELAEKYFIALEEAFDKPLDKPFEEAIESAADPVAVNVCDRSMICEIAPQIWREVLATWATWFSDIRLNLLDGSDSRLGSGADQVYALLTLHGRRMTATICRISNRYGLPVNVLAEMLACEDPANGPSGMGEESVSRINTAGWDFWCKLEAQFRSLHDEYGSLSANWCSLNGKWSFYGSGEQVFESMAQLAAVGLGDIGGSGAVDSWLNNLRRERRNYQDDAEVGSRIDDVEVEGVYGIITRLFEASGNSCLGMLASARVAELHRAQPSAPNPIPTTEPHCRRSPREFIDEHRRHAKYSYEKLAARIGLGKDTLFAITKEIRWVSDLNYSLVAQACNCRPEDLHPRDVPRPERRR